MPAHGLPAWFAGLADKSGVYVIRRNGVVVYVGESHTGRLKKTLAHHFQSWTGKTAGPTYPRAGSTVAVEVTPASQAVDRQNELITRHNPPDNTQGKPAKAAKPGSRRPAVSMTWTQAAVEVFDAVNPF
jgi:excinuclease UvrABC nuclease subunit